MMLCETDILIRDRKTNRVTAVRRTGVPRRTRVPLPLIPDYSDAGGPTPGATGAGPWRA
jgi:hypothetical protein